MAKKTEPKLITHSHPRSPAAEAYRTIRTSMMFSGLDQTIRTILFTSANQEEGKSTTTANLAVTYAQLGHKVLLIDCDLRKPTMHMHFNLPNIMGLTNILVEKADPTGAIQPTGIVGLSLLTSGPIPPNPAELLGSRRMEEFLKSLQGYDFVFIDSPPVRAVTDAVVLASRVDGVVLVVKAHQTKVEAVQEAKSLLDRVEAKFFGVVLNHMRPNGDKYGYYYYSYGTEPKNHALG